MRRASHSFTPDETEYTEETVSRETRRNGDERSLTTKDTKTTKNTKRGGRSIGRRRRPAAMEEAPIQTAPAPSAACIGALFHHGCRRALHADQSNGVSLRLPSFLRCSCKTVPSVTSSPRDINARLNLDPPADSRQERRLDHVRDNWKSEAGTTQCQAGEQEPPRPCGAVCRVRRSSR
jgi:hypothetical protein